MDPSLELHPRRLKWLLWLFVATALLCSAHVQFSGPRWRSEWPWSWGEDISYIWFEGYHVKHGENPYSRISGKSLVYNEKFATYLPLFYLIAAVTQYPLPWYSDWYLAWQIASFLCYSAIGVIVFHLLMRRGWIAGAMLALLFWCYNRWSLSVLNIAHTDFLAVLFLLISILLIQSRTRTALICLGISLGIKHIAIVLIPLYLLWLWQDAPTDRKKRAVLRGMGWIALVPLAVSLPFMWIDFDSFVRTFLFSATRIGDGHFSAPSFDVHLWSIGLQGKVLMTFLFLLVVYLAAQERLPRFSAVFLTLLIFADFNSVAFRQYMVWPIPFLLLAPLDLPNVVKSKTDC